MIASGLGPVRPASAWRTAAWLVLAAGVLGAFYLWSYGEALGGFFHLDDYWVLAGGARIRIHSPLDVGQLFRPTHGFVLYRPVSTLVYFHVLHALFGTDPVGFHAVHLGFHVVNAVLVYALAGRLLGSRPFALATALVYAAAPGHALAAYWIALFTLTGTAFFYYLGLWAWFGIDGRWRIPVTLALFVVALLASEHAVSFPFALTLAALLLAPRADWRRLVREQAAFYVVLVTYLAGKVYAVGYLAAAVPPPDASQAYVWANYHMTFAPRSVLVMVGRYLAFGLGPLYDPERAETQALALGAGVVGLTVVSVACVLRRLWTARPLRVAAYGLALFLVALAPVAVLPAHLYSCYVGLAMLGLALALVGLAAAVPRVPAVAVGLLVAAVVAVHVRVTVPHVRQSNELRYVDSFSSRAARWLFALSALPDAGTVEEVVVPTDQVTTMIFDLGEAQRVFLCAPYRVRLAPTIAAERPGPGRIVLPGPAAALPAGCRAFGCVRRDCPVAE